MRTSPLLTLPFLVSACTGPIKTDTGQADTTIDINFQVGPSNDTGPDLNLDCGETTKATLEELQLATTIDVTACFDETNLSLDEVTMEVAYDWNGYHQGKFPEPITDSGTVWLNSSIQISDYLKEGETLTSVSPFEIRVTLYGSFWDRREI